MFLRGGFVLGALLAGAGGEDLARFEVREPFGADWPDEWLTADVRIDAGEGLEAGRLELAGPDGQVRPAQFYREGRVLEDGEILRGPVPLRVLFRTALPKDAAAVFRITGGGEKGRRWVPLTLAGSGDVLRAGNGLYELEFDRSRPLPVNAIRAGEARESLGTFRWPDGKEAAGVVDDWIERGPARAVLRRTFSFPDPACRYVLTLDFRAGDPWIDLAEDYALGRGAALEIDLGPLKADFVHHPHTYSARTFQAGGEEEDSTLEPSQHPIATLGPIWRDIWFGGGPFAFVYRSGAEAGLGIAAVRGSEWKTPEGVSLISQNLEVHGDRERPGRVRVRLPADGGLRRWAIVPGPPGMRKRMGDLVRSRADLPLGRILKEWVLEWKSELPEVSYGFARQWFGYFNKHSLNPTTFPRGVRKFLDGLFKKGSRGVKSRDLAFLAYVFMNPDYWPGPEVRWGNVGNPNFHTDMYNVPLKIGLLMPDHPHARRWVEYGVNETRANLMRDSYPGGAWAESLSYSAFFFHVVECARKIRDAGAADPFREWPRFREVARYLAALHTPADPRYGSRQKAPIGDTSPGNYVEELRRMAADYRGIDDPFAEQLARFPENWERALDLSSREFPGFGAMLRGNAYDVRHESFATVKAGPARNHYQGDELSFHFAGLGTPLAIDHACHYSPRPWSASMHNRPDLDGLRPVAIAIPRAMAVSPAADVFAADERTRRVNRVPLEPHHAVKPGWEYPVTELPEGRPWTMRRYAMLVKHDPSKSGLADYLVIRDEIDSPEPPWQNFHVLAREIEERGEGVFFFPGQLGVDLALHVFGPRLEAGERREWGWRGDAGEARRLKGKEYEEKFFGAWIPPDFKPGTWPAGGKDRGGEMTKWLRLKGPAGRSDWLMALVPVLRGKRPPSVERLSPTRLRVVLGDETEIVDLGSGGTAQAAVERGGSRTVLLDAGFVRPWSELEFPERPLREERGKP